MTTKIPDKPYLRIGEVARLLGTQTHVLRYWEDSFPQLKPVRAASGQRLFRKPDMETLLLIKRLLHDEGYTIAGARKRLAELDQAATKQPAPELGQLKDELKDILRLLD
ncbi:MAG: MerR family transcriptional regulator [Proteobacteria bacterium]|nr:MerR family transcriptional regulator [Pseudomonadota bacterium]MBU4275668.1 MerR family transcriptional regulator [Pseudomonadota bacterium]MBU4384679.1 MerR family transcriptional regulator [Pseudomonadota bacterium]MBU4604202.1 MerR family transcriptional regulator [Pseudomonadota bacterium]MCG2765618.1 MerR family transcriptional regulator [Desulfarculaceae bacterium]